MRLPLRPIQSFKSRVLGPLMGTITRVKTQEPVIALTFDDGPHPEYTPRVLDLLGKYNAKATFFVVGQLAEQYPAVIERIRAEGHALGNHTYTHAAMSLIKGRERRKELRACEKVLGPQPVKLFRPPWGMQSRASRFDLLRLGDQVVAWNIVADDWLKQEPEDLAQRIIAQAKPGGIVLLHDWIHPLSSNSDSCKDRGYMVDALAIILPKLAPDLRFVTVPQMLQLGRPIYRAWYR